MTNEIFIPDEIISNKIYLIRNQNVMIDRDLAELYQMVNLAPQFGEEQDTLQWFLQSMELPCFQVF